MYMCYLLRYKPIAEGLGIEDTSSIKQEEKKADPTEKEREVIHFYLRTDMNNSFYCFHYL